VAGTDSDTGAGRLQAYEAIKRVGGFSGTGPAVPGHHMTGSSLRASGNEDQWSIRISSTSSPIAVTLIIPGASASKDFDIRLRAPNGTVLATSDGTSRQETIGIRPGVTGTYLLVVDSYAGIGGYDLDLSYAGSAPVLISNG